MPNGGGNARFSLHFVPEWELAQKPKTSPLMTLITLIYTDQKSLSPC